MPDIPLIPPGNQSPYPLIEPPHAHPEPVGLPFPMAATAADKPRDLAPKLIVGAVVAGAVAATVMAVIRSRRQVAATQRPAPKARRASPAKAPAVKRTAATAKTRKRSAKATTSEKPSPAPNKRRRRASADDNKIRGPQDASRMAMGEDYEVRYWTDKFGVDRDALQRAVEAVGNGAEAVERELAKS